MVDFKEAKKGYSKEQVDAYIQTLNSEYTKLTEEYRSLLNEVDKKIRSLEEINNKFLEQNTRESSKEKGEELSAKAEISKSKKGSIISDMIFYVALIAMIALAFIFSRGDGGTLNIGGYRIFEVLTASMQSVYPRGSVILVKETPVYELVVGDDITFLREDNNIITHRIIEIKEDYEGSGQRGLVTKGVDNATADDDIILEQNIIGKVVRSFPKVVTVLNWASENIAIVGVFFLALMGCSFFLKIFWRERSKEKAV